MTDAVTLQAKRIWLDKFQGASLQVPVELGSPLVQNAFKRSFYITARNSHFISVFGRILLGEEKITEPEKHVRNAFNNAAEELDRKLKAAQAIIADAAITRFATYGATKRAEVQIITPISRRHLELLVKADEFLLLVNTLWLHGEIDGSERARRELEVKRKLRGVVAATRNMFLALRNELNRRRPDAARGANAEAAKLAGDAANDPGDADIAADGPSEPPQAPEPAQAEQVA